MHTERWRPHTPHYASSGQGPKSWPWLALDETGTSSRLQTTEVMGWHASWCVCCRGPVEYSPETDITRDNKTDVDKVASLEFGDGQSGVFGCYLRSRAIEYHSPVPDSTRGPCLLGRDYKVGNECSYSSVDASTTWVLARAGTVSTKCILSEVPNRSSITATSSCTRNYHQVMQERLGHLCKLRSFVCHHQPSSQQADVHSSLASRRLSLSKNTWLVRWQTENAGQLQRFTGIRQTLFACTMD